MDEILVQRWWVFLIRGVLAILFGLACVLAPRGGLYALVTLFGVFAIVDGVVNLGLALRRTSYERHWGSMLFGALASIIMGLLALIWPTISALALLIVIALWSIGEGIAHIVAAIRLRQHIKGEWLLALSGLFAIAFGVLLLLFPAAGALALVLWIGAYAFVAGVVLVTLAFKVRAWGRDHTGHPHMPASAVA
jgi:uncharacterized membrane protein HdeD (DUF308 family)